MHREWGGGYPSAQPMPFCSPGPSGDIHCWLRPTPWGIKPKLAIRYPSGSLTNSLVLPQSQERSHHRCCASQPEVVSAVGAPSVEAH